MKWLGFAAGCLVAVLLLMQTGIILADTIPVAASTDVWIREKSDRDHTYENDGLSVWARNQGTEGAYRRFGAIEFDISGIGDPIVGACNSIPGIAKRTWVSSTNRHSC